MSEAVTTPGSPARRRVAGIRRPSPGIVAGVIAVTGLAVILLAMLVWVSRGLRPLPVSFASGLLGMGTGAAVASIDIILGWRLVAHRPRNAIGWMLLVCGLTFAMVIPIGLIVADAEQAFRPAPSLTVALAWLQSSFGIPILVVGSLLVALLFPDGRFPGAPWRLVAVLGVVGAGLIAAAVALDPTGLVWYPTLPNPVIAPDGLVPLLPFGRQLGVALVMLTSAFIIAGVLRRYDDGDATLRAQLRWLLYAVGVEVALFGSFVMIRYLVPVPDGLGEVFVALAEAGSAAVPLAAAIAIMRYHLFGIDALISRTLLVVLLLAILGGLTTAVVAVTQRLFVAWTGQPSDVSVVVAAFLAATAYTPLRRKVEGSLDRWTKAGIADAPSDPIDPPADRELWETAAAVLAVRRFEQRWADDGDAAPAVAQPAGPSTLHRLPVDPTGRVACPRGTAMPVSTCLGCPGLVSVLASKGTVVCRLDEPVAAG